jgi:hypothetical protein
VEEEHLRTSSRNVASNDEQCDPRDVKRTFVVLSQH